MIKQINTHVGTSAAMDHDRYQLQSLGCVNGRPENGELVQQCNLTVSAQESKVVKGIAAVEILNFLASKTKIFQTRHYKSVTVEGLLCKLDRANTSLSSCSFAQ